MQLTGRAECEGLYATHQLTKIGMTQKPSVNEWHEKALRAAQKRAQYRSVKMKSPSPVFIHNTDRKILPEFRKRFVCVTTEIEWKAGWQMWYSKI